MNNQILQAKKLISTMQPATIEAYRVSSGVHIPSHIVEQENRIRKYKFAWIVVSWFVLIASVTIFALIPSTSLGRQLILILGIIIAGMVFAHSFIVEDGMESTELQDFLTSANRVLPLTKVDTSSDPFEDRVQQKLRKCMKLYETAKSEYEKAVREKGNFSTEAILTNGMRKSAASDLINVETHASYFGLRYKD